MAKREKATCPAAAATQWELEAQMIKLGRGSAYRERGGLGRREAEYGLA